MATQYGAVNIIEKYGQPSLYLQFSGPKGSLKDRMGDVEVEFTRSSVGTYVGSDGLIKTAVDDEPRFDHDPVSGERLGLLVEESRTNKLLDSALSTSNWQLTNVTRLPNAILSPDGTSTAVKIASTTGTWQTFLSQQSVAGITATPHTFSVYAKAGEASWIALSGIQYGEAIAYFNLSTGTLGTRSAGSAHTITPVGNGWYRCTVSCASASSSQWGFFPGSADNTLTPAPIGQGIYVWGAQLEDGAFPTSYIPTPATFTGRASTATYYDASGVIQTAGSGVARDDAYFPDENGVFRSAGLLLEAAVTNYIDESVDLTDTGTWTNYKFLAPTLNAGTAPDGTNTATSLVPNTETVGRSFSCYNIATTFQGTLTVSIFAKANGYNRFQLYIDGASAGGAFGGGATFDLSTGTVTQGLSGVGAIAELPNGWYRCSVTHTDTSQAFLVWPGIAGRDNSGNTSWAGDGTSGYLFWGAQLEASGSPTSYIPTSGSTVTRAADTSTSSTVTRAADVCTVTNSNIYDTDSFTIINQPFGASAGASTLTLFDGPQPIKRATVYSTDLSQTTVNGAAGKTDEFWRWRVLGSSFALPNFTTDGQVTVDWGDGTIEVLTTAEHTFTNGSGYHDIGFRLDSGTYFRPRINANSTHKDKLIAIGPAPESMKIRAQEAFNGCTNLQAFDPTIAANGETNYSYAWQSCSSLKNFPLIDTSGVTYMLRTWRYCSGLENFAKIDTSSVTSLYEAWDSCSSLTSFPTIDTSNVTDFSEAWSGCSSLTEFPVLDTSKGTAFSSAWQSCSSLTEFPSQIDVSKCSNFSITWRYCGGLTSFPALDFSAATSFGYTWTSCYSLTSFPTLSTTSLVEQFLGTWYACSGLTTIPICDYSSGTTFNGAWTNCANLITIPANLFDTTGTLVANAFGNAFVNDKLSAQSIENLLVSLVANGATGVTLNMNGGSNANTSTWSTAANNAYLELVNNRGWTITQNGTAPT